MEVGRSFFYIGKFLFDACAKAGFNECTNLILRGSNLQENFFTSNE